MLWLLAFVTAASAATYRVELDGTGDYTDIQSAVIESASGDTIRIGPGVYDTYFSYTSPEGGLTAETIVATDGRDLTLIGAGRGTTYIGPDELRAKSTIIYKVGMVVATPHSWRIEDMTIQNLEIGLYFWGSNMVMKNVEIIGCLEGAYCWPIEYVEVDSSLFAECRYGLTVGSSQGAQRALVTNVRCENNTIRSIQSLDVPEFTVNNCVSTGDATFFDLQRSNTNGVMRNCLVSSSRLTCITVVGGAHLDMADNELSGSYFQLGVTTNSEVTGRNNIFHGAIDESPDAATIYISNSSVTLTDCHIMPPQINGHSIRIAADASTEITQLDLTNNYWGVADSAAIAELIHDYHDDPEHLTVEILYEPFHEQPVGTEKKSMGSLKSMFR
jgi:hypothetical protein